MNAATPAKCTYYAWIILLCAALMNLVFLGFAWNTNQLYFAPILGDFPDFSRTSFTLTVTLACVPNAGLSMIFGKVLKKLGGKGVIVAGVAFSVGSLFLYSVATSLWLFYFAALLIGASIALVTTTTSAMLVNNWFAKHNGVILAVTTTASGIGGTIFPRYVTGWITDLGWRLSFQYTAVACLIAGAFIIAFSRITPGQMGLKPMWADDDDVAGKRSSAASEVRGVPLAEARKTRNFWALCALYFLMGIIIYSVQQTTSLFATTLGYSTIEAGQVISVLFVANMLFQIPLGALSDKFGVGRVMPMGLAVFTAGMVLLILPGITLTRLYVVGAIVGFSVVLMSVMVPIVVREVFGTRDFAGILGFVIGIRTIGIAVGTPLLNSFYDVTGTYQTAFVIYFVAMLGCILLAVIGTRKIPAASAATAEA